MVQNAIATGSMTKLELVESIEQRLGIASTNLWKADKWTLESILSALRKLSPDQPAEENSDGTSSAT